MPRLYVYVCVCRANKAPYIIPSRCQAKAIEFPMEPKASFDFKDALNMAFQATAFEHSHMLTSSCKYSSHFNRPPLLLPLPYLLKCQLLVSKCRYSIQVKDTFGPSTHDPNTNSNNNSIESGKKSFCAINFKVNTFPQSRAKDITSILFDLRRAAKRNNDNAGERPSAKNKERKESKEKRPKRGRRN